MPISLLFFENEPSSAERYLMMQQPLLLTTSESWLVQPPYMLAYIK